MPGELAVYAGTFDPLTNGHLWMIERGADRFDALVVAIGTNPSKLCLFTVEERLEMLKASTKHLKNVRVETYDNQFLVRYAQSIGAKSIVRGIRSESDLEYERAMRHINSDMDPTITTWFLMPPRDIAEVSSSMVKSLVGPEGWEGVVSKYVPGPVLQKIKEAKVGGAG